MLPAVIIHLLDIKSSNAATRELSLEGFGLCMQVMQGLRQSYSAADYATHFLEAAIKKADIQVTGHRKHGQRRRARFYHRFGHLHQKKGVNDSPTTTPYTDNAITIPESAPPSNLALTPPPDMGSVDVPDAPKALDENELQLKLESFLQSPPSPQHDDAIPLPPGFPPNSASSFTISSNGTLQVREELLFPAERPAPPDLPYLSIPQAAPEEGNNGALDALLTLNGQDNDPFFGHYGDAPLLGQKRFDGSSRAFGLAVNSSAWLEEDMSKILEGVEFDIDDVIQVLETEIN